MGSEAYGLVAFFLMLQAWFVLLDMGLTPTMSRETARFNGGATDALSYRRLVRALEGIFLLVGIIGAAILYSGADYIATEWLKVKQIPLQDVKLSIEYMAITIALRWMSGFYRGAISGYERLVWLSGFNAFIASVRFIGVLPVLIYVSHQATTFFAYQLAVSVLEISVLLIYSYYLFPSLTKGEKLTWEWAPLKPVLKFSLSIAFTSSIWVLVTQTDKLVLSKILSLIDYGKFTLAVLLASGITVISGAISSVIMPRMAKLEAEINHAGLIILYRESTKLVVVLAGTATIILAFYAEQLAWIWTRDQFLANEIAPIIRLYAFGNGILAVAAFPYYLQYAKGDLRLHFIGNSLFIIIFFPMIIWAAKNYGGIGAGLVWISLNALSFFAWLPLIHRKFDQNLNFKWYTNDVFGIFLPMIIIAYFSKYVIKYFIGENILVELILFGLSVISTGFLSSKLIKLIEASEKINHG
jgi:O-antigen/teichoic acid export membrane protein